MTEIKLPPLPRGHYAPAMGARYFYENEMQAYATAAIKAALQSQDREDGEVTAYALPGGIIVERCVQRDGSFLWAVRDWYRNCLSKSGEWDDEPFPSSRTDDWIAQHRFESAAEAIGHGRRSLGDGRMSDWVRFCIETCSKESKTVLSCNNEKIAVNESQIKDPR